MERRSRKWYWTAILVILSGSLFTIWYLQFNPQSFPLFLVTIIVATGFVVTLALLPEHRRRLVEKVMAYHAKEKSLGRLYNYKKVALALIFVSTLVFPMLWQYQLIPLQYVPFYAITFLVITIISGTILIIGLLKTIGKWVLLLIVVSVLIAILRILI